VTSDAITNRLRFFLLILSVLTMVATLVELVLAEHTGETLQLVPFFFCGAGLIVALAAMLRPGKGTVTALRVVMVVVALGGLVGIGIHLIENFEFASEVRPNAATIDQFVAAIKGAAPLLAPGTLVFAGLLGLAATYYHPALEMQDA
jgi:hypothetical protein